MIIVIIIWLYFFLISPSHFRLFLSIWKWILVVVAFDHSIIIKLIIIRPFNMKWNKLDNLPLTFKQKRNLCLMRDFHSWCSWANRVSFMKLKFLIPDVDSSSHRIIASSFINLIQIFSSQRSLDLFSEKMHHIRPLLEVIRCNRFEMQIVSCQLPHWSSNQDKNIFVFLK